MVTIGSPDISLIVCSRNRGRYLNACLATIRGDDMLEERGELILVDNGSSDDTMEIMETYRDEAPFPVKVVHERKKGLSNARNAGILASAGRIIAFTDDDCYLGPDYWKEAVIAFDSGRFQYCGGRILLHDDSDANYACNYNEAFELIPPHSFLKPGRIQGANMLLKRSLVDAIGLFDPMLGAGTPFRCEDIEYCARASSAGYWGAHVPSLVIYHHHRRKEGPDIDQLKSDNDYARGAYYAKNILSGEWKYLKGWIETTRSSNGQHDGMMELKGAGHYIRERMRKRVRAGFRG